MPVKTLERQPQTDRSDMSLAAEPRVFHPGRLKYDYAQVEEAHREQVQYATIAIQDYMSRASESIIRVGQELIGIKEILPDGQFLGWIKTEFGLSERMAQRMMSAARQYGDDPTRVSGYADSVIYLLSAPSMPDAAREEIEAQAQATGKPPTRREVEATVRKHKPAPQPEPAEPVYTEPVHPDTPDDLAQAGYRIEGHWTGKYHWKYANPNGPGAQFGILHETAEEAAADARTQIERGVTFYRHEAEPEPVPEPARRAGLARVNYADPHAEIERLRNLLPSDTVVQAIRTMLQTWDERSYPVAHQTVKTWLNKLDAEL